MLTENDVLDAINERLCEGFPDRTVYVNIEPQNFSRPAFAVESGQRTAVPTTRWTQQRTEQYIITTFERLDNATGACELTDLSSTQAQIMALFAEPFACKDRMLLARAEARAVTVFDSAAVALTLTFHDDIPSRNTDDPLIETVEIKSNDKITEVIK